MATDSHVALIAFPFGSHAPPVFNIMRHLADAAPTTLFSFFSTAQSNSTLLSSSDLPANIKVHDIPDGLPEGYVFTGNILEPIELFFKSATGDFRRAIAAAETEAGLKVKCIVGDALLWFAADMAEEMKASWVAFWISGANSFASHAWTDLIRQNIGVNDVDEKMEETLGFIPGMEKIRLKDTPEGIVLGDLNHVVSTALYQMSLTLPRATAVLVNSFQELHPLLTDYLRSNFKPYLEIAPFAMQKETLAHDPHGCLTWMDKRTPASVVYISFGSTILAPPPEELVAIAQGLESSKVPFIWSLKDNNLVHLPKGFVDRTKEQGIVVPWAPQVDLLKHEAMGVFVNHSGWNSVLESVSAGIPMICRPILGDHGINARFVEVMWEVGMTITNGVFTKEGFIECLDQVLVHDAGKKMKVNAKKLKEQAQGAASPKGSSFNNFKLLVDEIVKA